MPITEYEALWDRMRRRDGAELKMHLVRPTARSPTDIARDINAFAPVGSIAPQRKPDNATLDDIARRSPGTSRFLSNPQTFDLLRGELGAIGDFAGGAEKLGFFGGVASAAGRGFDNTQIALANDAVVLGLITPEDAADYIAEQTAEIRAAEALQPDFVTEFKSVMQAKSKALDETEGVLGTSLAALDLVWSLASRPRGLLAETLEQFSNSLPAWILGAAGAKVGAVVGAAVTGPAAPAGAVIGGGVGLRAGYFAGSHIVEFGTELSGEMDAAGVDLGDAAQVLAFLKDERKMAPARAAAMRKGLATSAVDTAFTLLAGRRLTRARQLGRGVIRAIAAEMGEQAVGEGAGELVGQVVREAGRAPGEVARPVSLGESLIEGVLSLGPGAVEIGVGAALRTANARRLGRTVEREDLSPDPVTAAREAGEKSVEAARTARLAEAISEMAAGLKRAPKLQETPSKIQELVQAVSTEETPRSVWFRPSDWREYWSSANGDALREAGRVGVTGGGDYTRAAFGDTRFGVPLDRFLAQYAATPHVAGLLPYLAPSATGMNLLESQDFLGSAPDVVRQLARESAAPVPELTPPDWVKPLFGAAEQAGMTAEQFAGYQGLLEQARAGVEKATSDSVAKVKKLRRAVRERWRAAMSAAPVFSARRETLKRKLSWGSVVFVEARETEAVRAARVSVESAESAVQRITAARGAGAEARAALSAAQAEVSRLSSEEQAALKVRVATAREALKAARKAPLAEVPESVTILVARKRLEVAESVAAQKKPAGGVKKAREKVKAARARLAELMEQHLRAPKRARQEVVAQVEQAVTEARVFTPSAELAAARERVRDLMAAAARRPKGEIQELQKALRVARVELANREQEAIHEGSKAFRERNPKLMSRTAGGGVSASVLAESFGFGTAESLLRALDRLPHETRVAEALTEAELGDLVVEASRGGNVDALHADAVADLMAEELRAVARRNASDRTILDTESRLRDALSALESGPVQQVLDPSPFLDAERRAQSEARAALKAEDFVALESALASALWNHDHFRATRVTAAALEKRGAVVLKASAVPVVNGVLRGWGLEPGRLAEGETPVSVAQWEQDRISEGVTPFVPDALRAGGTPFDQLTVRDWRETADFARQAKRLQDRRAKAAEQAVLLSKATDEQAPRDPTDRRRIITQGGFFERFRNSAGDTMASMLKLSTYVRMLDGWKDDGAWHRMFLRPANKATDTETTLGSKAAHDLSVLLKGIDLSRADRVIPGAPAVRLSPAGAASAFLNSGNPEGRALLLQRNGWSASDLRAVWESLPNATLAKLQQALDYIETFKPQIQKMLRVVGLPDPEWVQAVPIVVRGVTYRGGYYPLVYDRRSVETAAEARQTQEREGRIEETEELDVDRALGGLIASMDRYALETTAHGHRKNREGAPEGAKLSLNVDHLGRHVQRVIHDLTHYEMLLNTRALLSDRAVRQSVVSHYGPEVLPSLIRTVIDMAVGNREAGDALVRFSRWFRSGFTLSTLMINVNSIILQPLGIVQSIPRIGARALWDGYKRMLGDAAHMERSFRWVSERSPFMAARSNTFLQELDEMTHGKTLSWVQGAGMYLTARAQLLADLPVWIGAYNKALKEQGVDRAQSVEERGRLEQLAVDIADEAVRDTQGSGLKVDRARVQRGGELSRWLTLFYTYYSAKFQQVVERYQRTNFGSVSSLADFATDMLLLFVVDAALATAVLGAISASGEEDDELKREIAATGLSTIPVLKEFSGVLKGFRYQGPLRPLTDFATAGGKAMEGDFDRGFWISTLRIGGALFHVPTVQLTRTVEGATMLSEGETRDPRVLLTGPPRGGARKRRLPSRQEGF